MGYHRAGFEVVGVDIQPQPRYPFEFHQEDALVVLRRLVGGGRLGPYTLEDFAVIHASPPCQAYSHAAAPFRTAGKKYPDLLGLTREFLQQTGTPWVIENVPGAPMRRDLRLCGSQFGLPGLIRHRLFEFSEGPPSVLVAPCWHQGLALDVPARRGMRAVVSPAAHVSSRRIVTVVGNGLASGSRWWWEDRPEGVSWKRLCEDAMGINWMTRAELSEAIPPAYTEFIGRELLAQLSAQARPA